MKAKLREKLVELGFTNYWPMDEGTGATATDVISGVNGTIEAGATWAAGGPFGEATLAFDGAGGTSRVSHTPSSNAGAFTTIHHIAPTDYTTKTGMVVYGNSADADTYWGLIDSATKIDTQSDSAGSVKSFTVAAMTALRWIMLGLTRDGSNNVTVFINGVAAAASQSVTGTVTLNGIGRYGLTGGGAETQFNYLGKMSHVARLAGTALTATQMLELYRYTQRTGVTY